MRADDFRSHEFPGRIRCEAHKPFRLGPACGGGRLRRSLFSRASSHKGCA
jgi:hypothetical protein